jgi:signal transduction histidine kinase
MRHECTMHGCQLILRTPERAAQISGKRGRFSQVFMNLIKNAVQAYGDVEQAHARPVLVTAEARDGHVLITVSDRGNGIPVQYLGRVFDRAYSTRLAGQGMGYGLAIVQEIVTQDFSGNISVASTPGEGTTFTLVLPQHTAN